jgi:glutamate-1-semialdehyde aminotransferase
MPPDLVPLTLSVPVAGALLGLTRPTAYRLAMTGGFPLVDIGGRRKVSTAELERRLGQKLTLERLELAQRAAAAMLPKKAKEEGRGTDRTTRARNSLSTALTAENGAAATKADAHVSKTETDK